MLRIFTIVTALFIAFGALAPQDADAGRRFGGGRSTGMKRDLPPQQAPAARPDRPDQQAGAAPTRSGASRWLGPLAAFGLGALFMSMFGGSALAGFLGNLLMIVLLIAAVRFVMRMWQAKNAAAQQPLRYAANAPGDVSNGQDRAAVPGATFGASAPAGVEQAQPRRFPPGFDVAAFERQAKVSFIRLQAANDAGDLNDIRDYTTPELYGEIALQIQERGNVKQRVEVMQLQAQLLEVVTEGEREIASVQFSGLIREEENAGAEPLNEVWHVVKDANDPKSPWLIAGIQQN
jgi:predicted lipid-binding transport protein (Tim44 family)